MNKYRLRKKITVTHAISFLLAVFFVNPLYAKPKKVKSKVSVVKQSDSEENDDLTESSSAQINIENAIALPVERKERSYFAKIPSDVLMLAEDGSPVSLENAFSKIRKNESEYDESERVFLAVCSEIMKFCWPSEKITWDGISSNQETPYLEAIKSAKNGVFDSSTGNKDFLLTVLPALVILTPSFSDYAVCEESLNSAIKINPDSTLAWYLLGVLKEKQKNYVEAQDCYQKIFDKNREVLELQIAFSRVLRTNGKFAEAAEVIGTASIENQNSIDVLKQKAYVAFASKDFDTAELCVNKVLQQTPNDLDFVLFRAKILIEKNDYIHAVSLLDMYARQNDTALDYLMLRAKVQLNWSRNTAAALETVERALQLYPMDTQALLVAASIAAITDAPVAGKYADELAEQVLKVEPNNREALLYQLDGLMLHGNWAQSYENCKKLISSGYSDPELVMNYVQVCGKLNKKDEAYAYVSKIYKENPSDELILQAYVLSYAAVGSREEVLKFIDGLITDSSSRVKSYLYFRRSYLQKSEENALADLRSSLIANPRNSEALFRLYEMYYDKQDYRKAQYYLRQVVAINPNDTSVKKLNEALTKLIK